MEEGGSQRRPIPAGVWCAECPDFGPHNYAHGEVVLSALSHLFQNQYTHTLLQPLERMRDVLTILDLLATSATSPIDPANLPFPNRVASLDTEKVVETALRKGQGQGQLVTSASADILKQTQEIAKQVSGACLMGVAVYVAWGASAAECCCRTLKWQIAS